MWNEINSVSCPLDTDQSCPSQENVLYVFFSLFLIQFHSSIFQNSFCKSGKRFWNEKKRLTWEIITFSRQNSCKWCFDVLFHSSSFSEADERTRTRIFDSEEWKVMEWKCQERRHDLKFNRFNPGKRGENYTCSDIWCEGEQKTVNHAKEEADEEPNKCSRRKSVHFDANSRESWFLFLSRHSIHPHPHLSIPSLASLVCCNPKEVHFHFLHFIFPLQLNSITDNSFR